MFLRLTIAQGPECGTAVLVSPAGVQTLEDGAVGDTMVQIARNKIALDSVSAFARGILRNVLVCLAVWLCMGAWSVADKVLAIVRPIRIFVARGFEHFVANMFFFRSELHWRTTVPCLFRSWGSKQALASHHREHHRWDAAGRAGLSVRVSPNGSSRVTVVTERCHGSGLNRWPRGLHFLILSVSM